MLTFPYFRDLTQGEKFKNPIKANDKVIIVTGANTGNLIFLILSKSLLINPNPY
jgi:hypothetical protein